MTNHAQNESADVWSLQQLMDLLGPDKSRVLWSQISRTAGRIVAAAAGQVQAAAQQLKLPEDCAFELLGEFSSHININLSHGMRSCW